MHGKLIELGVKNEPSDNMLESAVEKKLRDGIRKLGGECEKVISQSHAGFPDRSIFLKGKHYVLELKRANGRIRSDQQVLIDLILETGNDVYVTYGISGVNQFLEEVKCL